MNRALAISEAALGPEHPTVGIRLNNLAQLYQDQGRYSEAEPLMVRALMIMEKSLGPAHPNTEIARTNLDSLRKAAADGQ